jgi:hypothetical protein
MRLFFLRRTAEITYCAIDNSGRRAVRHDIFETAHQEIQKSRPFAKDSG